jgi:UDP-glucuronate decarboxylase
MTKRIVVTGGAGFLGSNLCKKLLEQKHEVICVDNFYCSSKENIYELFDFKNFELLRHDITLPLYVECDEIYNLAAPASPKNYQLNPVQTIKTCVHGSINMLGLAKRTKAKILQASTSEIYGDPEIHPQNESYLGRVNINGPRACYDEGKRSAETLFYCYHHQFGIDVRVARIFNTYGPKMALQDGRVVSNFIISALKNEPLTVFGDGSQTRSFCYVNDMVEGLETLMSMSNFYSPVNIGNPSEITIAELARKIIDLTGSSSKVEFRNLPIDDPLRRRPDISLAEKKLCWTPKTDLVHGLKSTIDYFSKLV